MADPWDEAKRELQDEWHRRVQWLRQRYDLLREIVSAVNVRLHRFAEVNMELAEYHFKQGNYSDAALRYRFVLWKQPNNADAWAGLGVSLLKNGEPEKARDALQKALKLAPGHALAAATLASLAQPPA